MSSAAVSSPDDSLDDDAGRRRGRKVTCPRENESVSITDVRLDVDDVVVTIGLVAVVVTVISVWDEASVVVGADRAVIAG